MTLIKNIFIITIFIILIVLWYFFYKWAIDISVYTIDSYEPGPTILMVGGTHGNEPAGKVALNKLLSSSLKIKRGTLIVIPDANKSGGSVGLRWLMHNWLFPDLNRNYTDKGKEEISKKIIHYVNKSDFIIDFHEGWGFRNINRKSLGTTLSYTTENSKLLALELIDKLNDDITEDYKKFSLNEDKDDLLTLRNYAYRHNKDYILVETTGQNNIQKIETRVNQNIKIIYNVLLNYGMI